MASNVKDVTIKINVDDSDLKDTGKDFDTLNNTVTKGSKQMESSVGSLSKSLVGMGAALVGAFAIKEVIANAVKSITEFDQAIADLGAITGTTGEELEVFKKEVLTVSKETGKSAIEIAKAFQLIGSAQPELLKSADALGEVTKQAIILSQAGGIDTVAAAEALTKSMNQFGASASDAAMFTDILATSQQKGTATIEQLSESLKNVGAVARAAGLSFEDTNVALQALAKGGLTGAEAGTGLRGVLTKLSSQTDDEINPSLTSLSEVIENLSQKNLGLKEASKLVGLENAKSLLTLIAQKDVVNELTGELNKEGAALEQAGVRMNTVKGKTEQLTSQWERFVLSLDGSESVIGNAFKDLIDFSSAALSGLENLGATFDIMFGGIASASEETKKAILEDFSFDSGLEVSTLVDKLDSIPFDQIISDSGKVKDAFVEIFKKQGESAEDGLAIWETYVAQRKEQEEEVVIAVEGESEAIDKNTKATLTNEEAKKALKIQLDAIREEWKNVRTAADDEVAAMADDEEATDAFLNMFGLTDEQIEDRKARREQEDVDILNNTVERNEMELELLQQQEEAKAELRQQVVDDSLEILGMSLDAKNNLELRKFDEKAEAELASFQGSEEDKAKLEAKLEAKRRSIEKRAFQQRQILAIAEIGINLAREISAINAAAAANPANAVTAGGAGISQATILTALAIGKSVASVALVATQKFKDGGILIDGPGTETSDSIPAMLSKNESVIKAKQSKKHTSALKAINDDRFDDYLNRVVMERLYMGKRDKVDVKEIRQKDIKFPNGYNINNARAISKPIVDAIEDTNFLNGAGWL